MHSIKLEMGDDMEIKKTKLGMGTFIEIQVVDANPEQLRQMEISVDRAFQIFAAVERVCSRFSADSELSKASRKVGVAVQISPVLFETLRFALEMSRLTNGAFDPTIGKTQENIGFNRHYLTGLTINTPIEAKATFRDIILDEAARTMQLLKPAVIDLGAVAKGFAIDMASNELRLFEGFIVNAGGDLYAGGLDESGSPWKIGIEHPDREGHMLGFVRLSNQALCTSGSYERISPNSPGVHHLINARTKRQATQWSSCSIVAPYAMMADAFSTAAFLLEPQDAEELINKANLYGVMFTSDQQIRRIGDGLL